MKKLILIAFIFLNIFVNAQNRTEKFGRYTISITDVTGREMSLSGTTLKLYEGNYVIYKGSKKIAEQTFSATDSDIGTSIFIEDGGQIVGGVVRYDKSEKEFVINKKQKSSGNFTNLGEIILNGILLYAKTDL